MKMKYIAFLICTLLITTVLPVSGTVMVERTPMSTSFGNDTGKTEGNTLVFFFLCGVVEGYIEKGDYYVLDFKFGFCCALGIYDGDSFVRGIGILINEEALIQKEFIGTLTQNYIVGLSIET